ncbi:hypothetical protein HY501_01040 [Candidatus Woesearchaeota archaeon]|nr:hypothetical protein [Candidatus Woesearchaeota archaeon]
MADRTRIYLDTNMVHDFFVNQARHLKNKGDIKIPNKLDWMLQNKDRIEFVTSFLTKTEIARELASAHGLTESEINIIWAGFVKALECTYVGKFEFDEKITQLAAKIQMKLRTLVNFFHLFVAMREGAYFVTGDKDLIKKVRKHKIYDKVISYVELRRMFA